MLQLSPRQDSSGHSDFLFEFLVSIQTPKGCNSGSSLRVVLSFLQRSLRPRIRAVKAFCSLSFWLRDSAKSLPVLRVVHWRRECLLVVSLSLPKS